MPEADSRSEKFKNLKEDLVNNHKNILSFSQYCWFISSVLDSCTLMRIRILGSVNWIPDPDQDPAVFINGFQNANKKKIRFPSFVCFLRTVLDTFTSAFNR